MSSSSSVLGSHQHSWPPSDPLKSEWMLPSMSRGDGEEVAWFTSGKTGTPPGLHRTGWTGARADVTAAARADVAWPPSCNGGDFGTFDGVDAAWPPVSSPTPSDPLAWAHLIDDRSSSRCSRQGHGNCSKASASAEVLPHSEGGLPRQVIALDQLLRDSSSSCPGFGLEGEERRRGGGSVGEGIWPSPAIHHPDRPEDPTAGIRGTHPSSTPHHLVVMDGPFGRGHHTTSTASFSYQAEDFGETNNGRRLAVGRAASPDATTFCSPGPRPSGSGGDVCAGQIGLMDLKAVEQFLLLDQEPLPAYGVDKSVRAALHHEEQQQQQQQQEQWQQKQQQPPLQHQQLHRQQLPQRPSQQDQQKNEQSMEPKQQQQRQHQVQASSVGSAIVGGLGFIPVHKAALAAVGLDLMDGVGGETAHGTAIRFPALAPAGAAAVAAAVTGAGVATRPVHCATTMDPAAGALASSSPLAAVADNPAAASAAAAAVSNASGGGGAAAAAAAADAAAAAAAQGDAYDAASGALSALVQIASGRVPNLSLRLANIIDRLGPTSRGKSSAQESPAAFPVCGPMAGGGAGPRVQRRGLKSSPKHDRADGGGFGGAGRGAVPRDVHLMHPCPAMAGVGCGHGAVGGGRRRRVEDAQLLHHRLAEAVRRSAAATAAGAEAAAAAVGGSPADLKGTGSGPAPPPAAAAPAAAKPICRQQTVVHGSSGTEGKQHARGVASSFSVAVEDGSRESCDMDCSSGRSWPGSRHSEGSGGVESNEGSWGIGKKGYQKDAHFPSTGAVRHSRPAWGTDSALLQEGSRGSLSGVHVLVGKRSRRVHSEDAERETGAKVLVGGSLGRGATGDQRGPLDLKMEKAGLEGSSRLRPSTLTWQQGVEPSGFDPSYSPLGVTRFPSLAEQQREWESLAAVTTAVAAASDAFVDFNRLGEAGRAAAAVWWQQMQLQQQQQQQLLMQQPQPLLTCQRRTKEEEDRRSRQLVSQQHVQRWTPGQRKQCTSEQAELALAAAGARSPHHCALGAPVEAFGEERNLPAAAYGSGCVEGSSLSAQALKDKLVSLATAIATHDQVAAQALEREVADACHVDGTAAQRLAFHFLQGLRVRRAGEELGEHDCLLCNPEIDTEAMNAAKIRYFASTPFVRFFFASSCAAILRTVGARRCIHIVDLGFFLGFQWLILFRQLAARPCGPPHSLRITTLGTSFRTSSPVQKAKHRAIVEELARDLQRAADVAGIRRFEHAFVDVEPGRMGELREVEIRRSGVQWRRKNRCPTAQEEGEGCRGGGQERAGCCEEEGGESKEMEGFSDEEVEKCEEQEAVVVCACLELEYFPDDAVVRANPRDAFLTWLRSMHPDLLILMGHDVDANGPFFLSRFRSSLDFYSAVFDLHDALIPPTSREALLFEGYFHGGNIVNTVSAEGLRRFLRAEGFARWQTRLTRLGFRKGLSADSSLINMLYGRCVSASRAPGLGLQAVGGNGVQLTWKGQPTVFVSFWAT